MERVHFQQEQMLDELKDLVEKEIFTKLETKQILKKRTEFEGALVRRVAKKADFLRYAAYEMSLEQLRRKRIERLKIESTKASISDYSLVRRQFQIFERALKRFKSDVDLWLEYINVAQREGASTLVGRVVARAIQLHPDNELFYVVGAAHELEHGSPSAARNLLQRGIRINGQSVKLWTEYVRMELIFMENLRKRWQVLGLDLKGKGREQDEARTAIIQGSIVKEVISQAMLSSELFEALIGLIKQPELLDVVYRRLAECTDPRAAILLAMRPIHGKSGLALIEAVQHANEEMLSRCDAGGQESVATYIDFCERVGDIVTDESLKAYLDASVKGLVQKGTNSGAVLSSRCRAWTQFCCSLLPPSRTIYILLKTVSGPFPNPYPQLGDKQPMLQFPTPHPPTNPSDYSRPNDIFLKRQQSAFSTPTPLSVSTNLPRQPSPTAKLRSPYISSRPNTINLSPRPAYQSQSSHHSSFSSVLEDVLQPGDIVGEGVELQGELIRLVSPLEALNNAEPAREFEVVRRLGAGSYAVVYQVLEVLERAPSSEDGHSSMMGHMDFDGKHVRSPSTTYGREYAIKCLSKANLDDEALRAQMDEVTIHQSLHPHPNIVTLHRTLETSSFLLLLLEYVPGEDLFYFLEQAHDHYESSNTADLTDPSVSPSRTPPTPSLLSTMNSSQLLSRTRLRLISSMFSQMCDAVAACHAQQVYHRDIKPENFIVTDGYTDTDGRRERKVIVKLTDFGLSTTDVESSDMDCGSAPYMSFECRNNVAPSYRPRAADVWSLGIVLINMLYHFNPWTDTKEGSCSSFDLFRQQPVNFFMHRFVGMTRPVAEHLANKVFNVLDDPKDDSERITAAGFGVWAKDLPELLGQPLGHKRAGSTASLTQGHRISCSIPISHRPSSRQASGTASTIRTPAIQSRSLSRAASFGPTIETTYEKPEATELSTVIDQEAEEQEEERQFNELKVQTDEPSEDRSPSNNKRRKRGARKGKGGSQPPATPQNETLETLASASQSLAREISRASRAASQASSNRSGTTHASSRSSRRGQPFEPVAMYALPVSMLPPPRSIPPIPPLPKIHTTPAPSMPATAIAKKPSKWKLSFGKSSGASAFGRVSPVEEASSPSDLPMSATASNVTDLIMGLSAPAPPQSLAHDEHPRGRRVLDPGYRAYNSSRSPHPDHRTRDAGSDRAVSPNSIRSHRPVASSSSSMVSGNWRSSLSTTSSAGTSTSAFTRYSNASTRSVSTVATSVSASSWRAPPTAKPQSPPSTATTHPVPIPKNVKIMNGVPWELDQLPRGQYTGNPEGDIFGSPPVRQPRPRKPKDLQLSTITEKTPVAAPKSPDFVRRADASTSTTDLVSGVMSSSSQDEDSDGRKKVAKAQINTLAKMLSALRR
ncbi:Kinase-like protein [Mycena indigotica]|uniref:Kinase-like protein n=1 Tax=Mycena indigotica TaxID=2126181 RepID=A0A8H6TEK3_9AGAR|nr:Kinase-like protein [Mycena indigotica]KAF7315267.1 Kinase-like protein [Mycena indigotica]